MVNMLINKIILKTVISINIAMQFGYYLKKYFHYFQYLLLSIRILQTNAKTHNAYIHGVGYNNAHFEGEK